MAALDGGTRTHPGKAGSADGGRAISPRLNDARTNRLHAFHDEIVLAGLHLRIHGHLGEVVARGRCGGGAASDDDFHISRRDAVDLEAAGQEIPSVRERTVACDEIRANPVAQ